MCTCDSLTETSIAEFHDRHPDIDLKIANISSVTCTDIFRKALKMDLLPVIIYMYKNHAHRYEVGDLRDFTDTSADEWSNVKHLIVKDQERIGYNASVAWLVDMRRYSRLDRDGSKMYYRWSRIGG